jgi:hypothetical protein
MPDMLYFTVGSDGATVVHSREVEAGTGDDELNRFKKGHLPYHEDWIDVAGGASIPRDKIIGVQLVRETDAPDASAGFEPSDFPDREPPLSYDDKL